MSGGVLATQFKHQVLDLHCQLPVHRLQCRFIGIGVAGGAPGVNAELELGGEYTIIVLSNLALVEAADDNRLVQAWAVVITAA